MSVVSVSVSVSVSVRVSVRIGVSFVICVGFSDSSVKRLR